MFNGRDIRDLNWFCFDYLGFVLLPTAKLASDVADNYRSAGLLDRILAALRQAGTPVEINALPGRGLRGHMQINREMGDADYAGTGIVDAWLRRLFGQ